MNTSELRALAKNQEAILDICNNTEFLGSDPSITLRQRLWHIDNQLVTIQYCKTCNVIPVNWNNKSLTYRTYCSSKCAHTNSATREKRETTCLEKYGYLSNLSAPANKQRQKETCLKKYGVDNFSKSLEFSKKYTDTCLQRYGVSNTSKLAATKSKIDNTHITKYDRLRHSQIHISADIINLKNNEDVMRDWFINRKMPVTEIAAILGVGHSQLCMHFKTHLGIDIHRHNVSSVERNIGEYLTSLDIQFETSNRTILKPKELDIYVPSANIAIELNGTYWHSELRGKDKHYHVNKLTQCKLQQIQLLQILDNEWLEKQEIVKSRLSNIFNKNTSIWARKCTINLLDHTTATEFFNISHIQGSCVHAIAYGLYYNNTLVAAMSFGKSRYNKQYEWELIRYANTLYTNVVGGAGKLFSHFLKLHQPISIVSYCDLRWNTGVLYEKLGFTKLSQSDPNYWYFKPGKPIESRIKYQKHKLVNLLSKFDPALTEWENMVNHGYDRIWDCGNLIFTFYT